jgi:hypothetical protein
MNDPDISAMHQVFSVPELMDHIISYLFRQLLPITDLEDPRSIRVHQNASILHQILRLSEINRAWHHFIFGSNIVQRALFRLPDIHSIRSWDSSQRANRERKLHSWLYTVALPRPPQLNPIIQTTFPAYHFRFWHLSLESTNNKHVAYLIITRRDLPAVQLRCQTGQGRCISEMLLSQPPPMALEATIWDERDESKDYIGRTNTLADPVIRCEQGVTIGLIHERVSKMFSQHRDVAAIKLTTI